MCEFNVHKRSCAESLTEACPGSKGKAKQQKVGYCNYFLLQYVAILHFVKFLMIRGKGLSVFTLFQTLDETSCSYSSWLCSKSPCQWLDLLIFFILVYFNFVQIWTVNIASIYTRFTKICYENWGGRTRHWNSLYVPLLKCWYLLIQHQIECCLQLGKMLLFFFTASESSRTRLPSVLDPQDSVSLCCFL